jgi:hypothetical protein
MTTVAQNDVLAGEAEAGNFEEHPLRNSAFQKALMHRRGSGNFEICRLSTSTREANGVFRY